MGLFGGSSHPGVELRANLKSISHRCHLFEVAFVWELTKETIDLPQGGTCHHAAVQALGVLWLPRRARI